MSHTPIGGHPQGWEHKLADRSSLPPAPGEEKSRPKHVFAQPTLSKMAWREETEGSSGSSTRSPASPPYMRWARTLHDLLEDAEGVRLFRKFVSGAGGLHLDRLNFYFAVQGLHQEADPNKIRQVVSAIYKFLRKSQLTMAEEVKLQVKQSLKDGSNIDRTIFDSMEQEVTRAITETTYLSFLRSEAYVSYVSAATQPLSSPDDPRDLRESAGGGGGGGGALATLHEGEELCARLTPHALRATVGRRLQAPHRKRSVYSAHVTYAGYCPTSRQDSERASLSSGRTDSDAVSLSGGSVDGMSVLGAREAREAREARRRPRLHGLDRHAVINKEQDTAMVIPRTQRMQSEQFRVLPPSEFAPLLIEKLERVRREQETKEQRMERRLAEGDSEDLSAQGLPPQLVAAAIREKLQLEDDNDQDILDQHVSRVWSERTPGASPPPRRARARRPPSLHSADSGLCEQHTLSRRSFSKKTVTELTDSGVSVVSEGTTSASACASAVEPRILMWIAEGNERYNRSLDRSADRNDHRRRDKHHKTRGSGSKSSSTSGGAEAGTTTTTVVVVTFLDEPVPYRFKVPASPLTLKTFKEYLPRKGNYRYFFKTECADLDNTVIQEEVCSDSDTLPMFEGKVMARVKSIE